MSDIVVKAKTTRENGLQARPSHTFPVPPIVQFANTKPVSSSFDALPCAVKDPSINFDPAATGFAMEISWQFCN
ncbi:hypothetical protein TorRG33x02_339020 [Trema orientale]|uniref:Uncharacterized protein n=1 Tax=Trema orientale TaxID=63057 RepID=A0A2P5AWV7_TREOI|nr:hypothetical protein TorRG33x02_339020 [Trema orientale]